jgi:hypothetical protein
MSSQRSSAGGSATGASPPPAAVPQNDWTPLEVPPVGEVELSATVSVLVEGPDSAGAAALTAAALAAQGLPESLVEVIVPGDGREPGGDLLILLGAGTIPCPDHLAAHARWHQAAADAVSLGPAAPIDGAGLDPGALRSGDDAPLADLLEPRCTGEDPFGLVLDLTADLTDLQGGLFLAAALGTLGVRRETYLAAGGAASANLPAPLRRLDLAYRLACHGALFAPETSARAWTVTGRDEAGLAGAIAAAAIAGRTLELDHPEAASLVPLAPFRPTGSPRRFRRPALTVDIDAGGEPASEVLATIEPVLGGRLGDFELRIQVDDGHPEREAIAAAAADDPRVAIGPLSTESFCESPFQVLLPAVALTDPRTIADLHSLLVVEGVGALHVTVPGAPPDETMIEALATGPLARARRVAAATGEDAEAVLGRLFGERWVSGVEVSVRRHGVEEPHVTEHGPLAAATDADHERIQHLRFRDRADDLDAKTAAQARRIIAERLRTREERLRAEQLEARLRELG